jgi:hypothetical protein
MCVKGHRNLIFVQLLVLNFLYVHHSKQQMFSQEVAENSLILWRKIEPQMYAVGFQNDCIYKR